MKKGDLPGGEAKMRSRAEEIARLTSDRSPDSVEALSPEDTQRILHELRVHQIELEMQNEELIRAQAELDSARARYFDLYDRAPVGYATISDKGFILEANLTAATLLGFSRGALANLPISRLIFKEDLDVYEKYREQLFYTGEQQSFELRMVKKNNTAFWARLELTIAQVGDEVFVCRAVMIDITERKRAEEEKEKLQGQLLQAKKMESIGRLAGGVAHDFNNMLSVILGHTELAFEQVAPGQPLYESLQEISKAAKRSADITRQLLAFARKQVIIPKVLDLNETLSPMLNMIRRLIGEDIEVVWAPGKGLWKVKIDPSQLDQILANLATNARDSIAGAGHIAITTNNVEIDKDFCDKNPGFVAGKYVILTVSDDGKGIEKELLPSIFEPFFTTKEISKGTGLGLAMVFGIIKQNEGFIEVRSEPGHGATFNIYLPRVEEPESHDELAAPALKRGSETVLIVEDEEANLGLFKIFMQALGYKVFAAKDPLEAIAIADANEIDLLITDVVMPGMNGYELEKKLTASRPRLRCLFMSGYTADVIAHRGILEGGLNFIQKPFSIRELGAKVREVLEG
jgi:PAS domain S-box-containing protein